MSISPIFCVRTFTRFCFFEEFDVSDVKPLKMETDRGAGVFFANAATYQDDKFSMETFVWQHSSHSMIFSSIVQLEGSNIYEGSCMSTCVLFAQRQHSEVLVKLREDQEEGGC